MNVYFAARYSRREELVRYEREMIMAHRDDPMRWPINVNSRWLKGDHQITDDGMTDDANEEQRQKFAMEDWLDILDADMVVCFTEQPRTGPTRGGRHVEFGAALALGKMILIVGPRENVFYSMPGVRQVDTWGEALNVIEHISENSKIISRADVTPKTPRQVADDLFLLAFGRKP